MGQHEAQQWQELVGPRALPCRWWMRPQGQDPQLLILDNDPPSACQATRGNGWGVDALLSGPQYYHL